MAIKDRTERLSVCLNLPCVDKLTIINFLSLLIAKEKFMKERLLILHDLVCIVERMRFNIVAYEFIELIIAHEITKKGLTIDELSLLESIRIKLNNFISPCK